MATTLAGRIVGESLEDEARQRRTVERFLEELEASESARQAVGTDGDAELGDLFADPDAADPAEEAGEALRRQAIRASLEKLPELERRVLELRFGFDGEQQTVEAIARALGVSRERVRTLEQQAFARLTKELSGVVDVEKDELAASA